MLEQLLLLRFRCALVLNQLRRIDFQLGTPHPFLGYLGSLSNGKYFPSTVAFFGTILKVNYFVGVVIIFVFFQHTYQRFVIIVSE